MPSKQRTHTPAHRRRWKLPIAMAIVAVGVLTWTQVAIAAPPTASFTIAPPVPTSGQKVTFNASASSDPDGAISRYAWEVYQREFTGAYPASPTFTGTGVSFDHTFFIPGLYKVRLTVTDSDGETATTEQVMRVNSYAFDVNFFYEPFSPLVGEEVTFTAVAFDAPDDPPIPFTGYKWDLDNDGRFGEGPGQVPGSTLGEIGPKVKRKFDAPGNYTVRLKVTDADGVESPQVATKTVTVVVTRPSAGFNFAPSDPLPGQPVTFQLDLDAHRWQEHREGRLGLRPQRVVHSRRQRDIRDPRLPDARAEDGRRQGHRDGRRLRRQVRNARRQRPAPGLVHHRAAEPARRRQRDVLLHGERPRRTARKPELGPERGRPVRRPARRGGGTRVRCRHAHRPAPHGRLEGRRRRGDADVQRRG